MSWGPQLKNLLEMKKRGIETQALKSRVILSPWLKWVVHEHRQMSSDRDYDHEKVPRPLTTHAIYTYWHAMGLRSQITAPSFIEWIKHVDVIWFAETLERINRNAPRPPKGPAKSRRG